VISVTLGVATMIVVNAVMAGFSHEMQTRIHGILSDLVFESHSLSGFQDPEWHMAEIRRAAGDDIVGMTPTVAVPAMLNFQVRGQWITRQVMFIGIDETTHAGVSDFGRYLQHPGNREQLSFALRDGGYDTIDSQAGGTDPTRPALEGAGWPHAPNRTVAAAHKRTLMHERQRLDPFLQNNVGADACAEETKREQAEGDEAGEAHRGGGLRPVQDTGHRRSLQRRIDFLPPPPARQLPPTGHMIYHRFPGCPQGANPACSPL
jgi:hypothetical protein